MKIIITEDQQKNLFKPRNLESRYDKWNSEQPIVDGKPINQYDSEGKKQGNWVESLEDMLYDYVITPYLNGEKHGVEKYYIGDEVYSTEKWVNGKYITWSSDHINESQQNNLFKPRNLDRWIKWNSEQPELTIEDKTFQLNQFDPSGNKIGLWIENPLIIKKNYIKTKPFMEELFNNLKVVKNFHNRTNYKLNGKIIFQNRGDNILTYFDNDFWRSFKEKYSLYKNYTDTKDLIKVWMEIKYGLGHLYPNQER